MLQFSYRVPATLLCNPAAVSGLHDSSAGGSIVDRLHGILLASFVLVLALGSHLLDADGFDCLDCLLVQGYTDCFDNVLQGVLGRKAVEAVLRQMGILETGDTLAQALPQVRANGQGQCSLSCEIVGTYLTMHVAASSIDQTI